jgi:hypothetical protein
MVGTVKECSSKDSMTFFYRKSLAGASVVNSLALQLALDRGG